MTQYVSEVVLSKKFPAIYIPSFNPRLVYCLITSPNERTLVELFNRPATSQLQLDYMAQAKAKIGYQYYWEYVVNGSENPVAKSGNLEAPEFRDDYYKNVMADSYKLIGLDLKEANPASSSAGYSIKELREYLKSIDPKKEYGPVNSNLAKEEVGLMEETWKMT